MRLSNDEKNGQNRRLLRYLEGGESVNPMRAWKRLGIYRLSARVYDLRMAGHDIKSRRINVANRFGEVCSVSCYWISA